MFYSGDWDNLVPFKSTISNIERLGMRQLGSVQYWIDDKNQHLGFKRTYVQGQKQIKFWVIKGAGHTVPTWKRSASLSMFKTFLSEAS